MYHQAGCANSKYEFDGSEIKKGNMSDTVSKPIVADAFLEALAEVSETTYFLIDRRGLCDIA